MHRAGKLMAWGWIFLTAAIAYTGIVVWFLLQLR
jgi:hypothetical protein